MRVLLDGLLPRLFPGLPFKCVKMKGRLISNAASRASSARGGNPVCGSQLFGTTTARSAMR